MKQAALIPMLKFEKSILPFRIQMFDCLTVEQEDILCLAHSHDHYEVLWLTNGSGTVNIDLQDHPIEKNRLFLIKPGQVHQVQATGDVEGFIFSFTDSFLQMAEHEFDLSFQTTISHFYSNNGVITIHNEIVADIREVLMKMVKEFEHELSYRSQLLSRYFKIFLIYLSREFEEPVQSVKHSRETELVNKFLDMLEKSYKEKKMVAEYAAQLSVTPNYLNGTIKKNTGYSAGHLIRKRVVLEAKRVARYSDAGMKEIAYSLGFSDSAHFSKFFKSVCGINFSDFKREGISYALHPESLTA